MYLYLHIPFCVNKCPYCAFASKSGRKDLFIPYINALKKELHTIASHQSTPLQTLFLGGGTPTVLPVEMLCKLLEFTCNLFGTTADIEISVEANPGTINYQSLRELRTAGANRLSIGVQSLNDNLLAALGRIHNAKEAVAAVTAAKRARFTNINLDLMYGIYGLTKNQQRNPKFRSTEQYQSVKDWQQELQKAIALEPQHLSLYQLSVEEETPLFDKVAKGSIVLPDEETIIAMDAITEEITTYSDYIQYETSNYAQKNAGVNTQCRHNLRYWYNKDFAAAGAAATSFLNGCRIRREPDPVLYIKKIERNEDPALEKEHLSPTHSFCETVIMGLRMTEGIDIACLHNRFAALNLTLEHVYGNTLNALIRNNLLERNDTHLRLSRRGRAIANHVMAQLVLPENSSF